MLGYTADDEPVFCLEDMMSMFDATEDEVIKIFKRAGGLVIDEVQPIH